MSHEFKLVASNFPIVNKLKNKKVDEGYQLIGWSDQYIYIISPLTQDEIQGQVENKQMCKFNELMATGIIEVYWFNDKLYTIDSQGMIYGLNKEIIKEDSDNDIFDDSPKNIEQWQLKKIIKFIDKGEVLSSCQIKDGIASIVQEGNKIMLYLYYLNKKSIQIIQIHEYEGTIKKHNPSHIIFIEEQDVSVDFVRHWFPPNTYFSGGIFIIVLPETIVCGVVENKDKELRPYFFFDWPFKAVHITWKILQLQESLCNYLLIFFDGGNIVALGPYGEHILHYPLNKIENLFVFKNSVYTTDNSDCYKSSLSQNFEAYMLPIKGVVGFCELSSSNILLYTRHRIIYNLNIDAKKEDNEKFKLPQISILDNLLKSADYLEQLSKDIQVHDKYINALSYSVNQTCFKFDFNIQIISIAGYSHTIRIFIEMNNRGLKLCSDSWHLALSISSSDLKTTLVRELQNDFSKENPLQQFFILNIQGNDRFLEIEASFISFLVSGKFRPSIHIGKKNLNITYFVEPVSSIALHELHTSKILNVKEILGVEKNENMTEQRNFLYSISVPCDKNITLEIFQHILHNSKPLWRTAEWELLNGKNMIDVSIVGKCIQLELKDSYIVIKSDEIHICYQLKLAIIALIMPSFKLSSDEAILMEVENSLKSLEILEYQKGEVDLEMLLRIFNTKKNFISNKILNLESTNMKEIKNKL